MANRASRNHWLATWEARGVGLCGLLIQGLLLGWVLCCNPAQARAEWRTEFQFEQFHVHSEVLAGLVFPAIKELPPLKQRLAEALQIEVSDTTIDILIFSSSANYRAYIRQRVPEAVNRPAVFVKGPDALWVHLVYKQGWEVDLRHETTHALLHGSLPYMPIWLDEGLAKYFELPTSAQGMQTGYRNGIVWRNRFRQSLRTKELEQLRQISDVRGEHYRDSWAWVYFCLHHSDDSRRFLQEYLQTIQREEVAGSFFNRFEQQFPQAHSQAIQLLRSR